LLIIVWVTTFSFDWRSLMFRNTRAQLVAVLAAGALLGALAASAHFPLGPPAQAAPPKEGEEVISFEVRLPADALLEIDGNKTTSTGEIRKFDTPPLRVGGRYTYTLKATANGKAVTRQIDLAHGAKNTFDLRDELLAGGAIRPAARVTEAGQQDVKPETPTGKGQRAQDFIAAFNRGDAKAVASFYMPDGVYTDQDGHQTKGREALEKLYTKAFAERKGAKLNIIVNSVKQLAPDVGIEDGINEVTPAGGGLPSAAHFTAVLVKKDGEWHIQSIQESVVQPPSNAEHFEDLEWLIGDWTGEAEKGESGKASYAWADNRNFIVSSFATTVDGVPVVGGTQWIAWDAVEKRIRSWSFYSRGGFGEAVWSKDGNQWTTTVTARTASGKKVTANNILTKQDDDHCTWQITKLVVDDKPMPDPPAQKLKRVKPPRP
jgi:uncharacterized protein (TIGR02246 family)